MVEFKFRDALLKYFKILSFLKEDLEKGYRTKESFNELRYQNIDWFKYIKHYAFDFKDLIEEITDKRILKKKEYILDEDKRCPGCEDGAPYKIIKYRGIMIPVYNDDYGQQDFALILGKEISGGSYNLFSTEVFIDELDYILEEKYLNNDYDMDIEIKNLYPKHKEE